VDKRQSFCLLIEICGVDADVVIWHENRILCNEFDVKKVLCDDRHRFLQNTLIIVEMTDLIRRLSCKGDGQKSSVFPHSGNVIK
jgi:hypothetical protein